MNRPTTAARYQHPRPALPSGMELPEHLRGSREAIFHLLRDATAPKEPAPSRPVTISTAIHTFPARSQGAATPANNPGIQGFFQEDQFEFFSIEGRSAAVRGYVTTENRMIAS